LQDIVCNALDNIPAVRPAVLSCGTMPASVRCRTSAPRSSRRDASSHRRAMQRMYVDGRCVMFEKPLLESGANATKRDPIHV
jgi:hypothetical protein